MRSKFFFLISIAIASAYRLMRANLASRRSSLQATGIVDRETDGRFQLPPLIAKQVCFHSG
jgi:hypothetical protein